MQTPNSVCDCPPAEAGEIIRIADAIRFEARERGIELDTHTARALASVAASAARSSA